MRAINRHKFEGQRLDGWDYDWSGKWDRLTDRQRKIVVDWFNGNRVDRLKVESWTNGQTDKSRTDYHSGQLLQVFWQLVLHHLLFLHLFPLHFFLQAFSGSSSTQSSISGKRGFLHSQSEKVKVFVRTSSGSGILLFHYLCKTCSIYQTGCYSMLHHHNCSQVYCFHHHRNCHGPTQVIHILL